MKDHHAAKAETNWLVSRIDRDPDSNKKPRKSPCTKIGAGPIDRLIAAVLTREEARAAVAKLNDGADALCSYEVGYLARVGSADVGIDLDYVLNADGSLKEWGRNLIGEDPIELRVTPSGLGLRAILPRGEGDDWSVELDLLPGNKTFGGIGFQGSESRFFTVPEKVWREGDPNFDTGPFKRRVQALIRDLQAKRANAPKAKPKAIIASGRGGFDGLQPDEKDWMLADALSFIDSFANYDEWLALSMAAHASGAPHAFDIWDHWCRALPSYDEDENAKKWETFQRGGNGSGKPVTVGSILGAAKARGWDWQQALRTMRGGPEQQDVAEDDAIPNAGAAELPHKERDTEFEFDAVGDLEYREPEYVVGDLIETESLGLIFGDPGGGKSFLAIDMGLCVAIGTPFHGKEVRKGPVIMIAGEGHNGLARRFAAWAKDKGLNLDHAPLFVSRRAGQFLDQASANAVCKAVDKLAKQHGTPRLIIVDTVARNFGAGDENSTMDMGMFVTAMDGLKTRYPGSTVMLVHHTGHFNKNRARGATALNGAIDFEYRVEAENKVVTVTNTKMKNGPQPGPMHFTLEGVQLEGKATGAVLRSSEAPPHVVTHTPTQKLALATYEDAAREHGIWKEAEDGTETFEGVHVENWRDAFYPKHTGDTPAGKRQAFHRARRELVEMAEMRVSNDIYVTTSRTTHGMLKAARMIQRDKRDKA
ncbi:AAA family ATPase [Paracoccus sp. NGMCC 1.201697]|uniref:AAA family ATPase n=1 Tax=Paracoccus broussonetiae subsp. drimophilus TaxID=3373869 RepID=A0ABW7LEN8_9RHOB